MVTSVEKKDISWMIPLILLSIVFEMDWVIMKFLVSAVMKINVWFYWTRLLRFVDKKNGNVHKQFYHKKVISFFKNVLRGHHKRFYNVNPKSL